MNSPGAEDHNKLIFLFRKRYKRKMTNSEYNSFFLNFLRVKLGLYPINNTQLNNGARGKK